MSNSANNFTHTLWAGAKQPGRMHRDPEDQGGGSLDTPAFRRQRRVKGLA